MYKAVWLNWIGLNLGLCIQAFNKRYKIRSRDMSFQSWSVGHWFGRIAVRKPLLRSVNKQKRLKWAKEHEKWTVKQWKKVLWTDESKFQLFGQNRRVFVRRQNGERMTDGCVVPTVKHGGGSVLVWRCFGGESSGDLVQIKGIMRKEQYHSILQRHANLLESDF